MAAKVREARSVPASSSNFLELFGLGGYGLSASGVAVTTDNALGVPAVWASVNFLSNTLAALPLHLYRRRGDDRERVRGGLASLLQDAANEETTSYEWRKLLWSQTFTSGRSFTFIERNAATQRIVNLWPLDPGGMIVRRAMGRKRYEYRDGDRQHTYAASEIIDIPFMLKPNGVDHRGPIATCRDVIGMAIAGTEYASKFFQGGGVPPFAVTGEFVTPAAMQRAAEDLASAVRKTAKEQRQALVMPNGMKIVPIGADPEKAQLIEVHRFLIEQIARVYSLPPVFLQDLSHGTYSNTEQQDLHFVKHTLKGWIKLFEQELNLKLFGRTSNIQFVEIQLDDMLRGDFKTRMDGYSVAIQHGVRTPNEVRRMENLPADPSGDKLFMQGAMVPIDALGQAPVTPPPEPSAPPQDEEDPTDAA